MAIHHRLAGLRRKGKSIKAVAGKLGQQIKQAEVAAFGQPLEGFKERADVGETHIGHVAPIGGQFVDVRVRFDGQAGKDGGLP